MKITPWNFSDSHRTELTLDDFLTAKEAAGVKFFDGQEPWLDGIDRINWQTFFRVCTREMDDLSRKAVTLVIEYCLEILEEIIWKLNGESSRARFKAALDAQYAEKFENRVYQYQWAMRHPVINEAITRALSNRFHSKIIFRSDKGRK